MVLVGIEWGIPFLLSKYWLRKQSSILVAPGSEVCIGLDRQSLAQSCDY